MQKHKEKWSTDTAIKWPALLVAAEESYVISYQVPACARGQSTEAGLHRPQASSHFTGQQGPCSGLFTHPHVPVFLSLAFSLSPSLPHLPHLPTTCNNYLTITGDASAAPAAYGGKYVFCVLMSPLDRRGTAGTRNFSTHKGASHIPLPLQIFLLSKPLPAHGEIHKHLTHSHCITPWAFCSFILELFGLEMFCADDIFTQKMLLVRGLTQLEKTHECVQGWCFRQLLQCICASWLFFCDFLKGPMAWLWCLHKSQSNAMQCQCNQIKSYCWAYCCTLYVTKPLKNMNLTSRSKKWHSSHSAKSLVTQCLVALD